MREINWQTVKFRASSWGNLLAEAKSKADADQFGLGLTCQKELVKVYNMVMYGRKKDLVMKQMEKGIMVEPESIQLFSMLEGKMYFKNQEPLENEFFTGHPDIFTGESIFNAEEVSDIKSSWELDTFMPKLIETADKGYERQLNVYYDLTNAKSGNLAYTLVSAPQGIVESEKRKLLYNMNVISEESPEYIKAAMELERNLVFEDIPPQERVIKIPVPRNDELIQKMKDKVPVLRNWLQWFHETHMGLYPKTN